MKAQESQQIDEVMADDSSESIWADDRLQIERVYNQFVSWFSPFQRAVRWTCSCIKKVDDDFLLGAKHSR